MYCLRKCKGNCGKTLSYGNYCNDCLKKKKEQFKDDKTDDYPFPKEDVDIQEPTYEQLIAQAQNNGMA